MSLRRLRMPMMGRITSEDLDDPSTVGYTSTNTTNQTSFVAVSSPNSPHAARLARIALAVQENKGTRHQQDRKSRKLAAPVRQQLPAKASTTASIVSTASTVSTSSTASIDTSNSSSSASMWHSKILGHRGSVAGEKPQQQPYEYQQMVEPVVMAGGHSSTAFSSSQYTNGSYPSHCSSEGVPCNRCYQSAPAAQQGQMVHQPGCSPVGAMIVEHPRQPPPTAQTSVTPAVYQPATRPSPEVTRWRTDHRTTYEVKAGSGRMRVSAPAGSSEAQLFDRVAGMHSHGPDASSSTVTTSNYGS